MVCNGIRKQANGRDQGLRDRSRKRGNASRRVVATREPDLALHAVTSVDAIWTLQSEAYAILASTFALTRLYTMGDLLNITPPKELTDEQRDTVFQHLFRRLAHHRNTFEIYALAESGYAELNGSDKQKAVVKDLDHWSQGLLKNAWTACQAPEGGNVCYMP